MVALVPAVELYNFDEYICRNKVLSHLLIPERGGRGVPTSAFYVAWLAEELIHRKNILCSGRRTGWRSLGGKRGCKVFKSNMQEYGELSSYPSM